MPKSLPNGLHIRDPVTITSDGFKGTKLGLVYEVCKYDGGVIVWIPTEGAKYVCIALDRKGDSITPLLRGP